MGERNAELFLNFVASLLLHTTDRLVVDGETKVQLIKYKTFFANPTKKILYCIEYKTFLYITSRRDNFVLPLEDSYLNLI